MKKFIVFILTVLVLSACSDDERKQGDTSITELSNTEKVEKQKEFTISATEEDWEISANRTIKAWTYNGTVPGEEIRVKKGDYLKVKLENHLSEPVTIHWHGVILPNPMDGVAGITQNAVQPGESFTYEFQAKEEGTYWYHSHQQSSNQVDKGLYGAFIVEDTEKTYDTDKVLIFDEWALDGSDGEGMMGNMGNMMGGMMNGDMGEGDMDTNMMYSTLSMNGKSGSAVTPLEVREGERVRLRLINAGYAKRTLAFNGQTYKMVANDGNEVKEGAETNQLLEIAPGERIDVEFESGNSSWTIEETGDNGKLTIPVYVSGNREGLTAEKPDSSVLSFSQYGEMKELFDKDVTPDLEYNMDLGVSMGMMQGGMKFTINDETFPDTENIKVNEGDVVKVNLTNDSMLDHPMHLHGHHFQVVSKNGEKLDKPLVKDLINVKPGESYEIIFKADNPGHWLLHCHDLVHANNGMVTVVKYDSIYSPFELEGEFDNQPE
ncbi:multicopper oxidase domain-containing protein [Bacillus sp. SCS-153A]|uniref:multicopper oxidase domain-containing protein n=1 Tax=Rossellomorea sedimentorum TaxID=3115294 RepID=UPI003905CF82